MDKNGLKASDLKGIAKTNYVSQSFRNRIRFCVSEAEKYRMLTIEMIQKVQYLVDPRYFLGLQVIFQLYDLVYRKIDVTHGSFTSQELNPTTKELRAHLVKLLS